jgi:hypothetical protein
MELSKEEFDEIFNEYEEKLEKQFIEKKRKFEEEKIELNESTRINIKNIHKRSTDSR